MIKPAAPSGTSDEQCPEFKKMLPCTCREKNRWAALNFKCHFEQDKIHPPPPPPPPLSLTPRNTSIATNWTYSVALTSHVKMWNFRNWKRWYWTFLKIIHWQCIISAVLWFDKHFFGEFLWQLQNLLKREYRWLETWKTTRTPVVTGWVWKKINFSVDDMYQI